MGKLLQPLSSVTVACDPVISKTSVNGEEYLEGFSDVFGEMGVHQEGLPPAPVPEKGEASFKPLEHHSFSEPQQLRNKSAGFARVLRRQSSVTSKVLRKFGEAIARSDHSVDGEMADALEECGC